jgi:hypothetical protein
MLPKLYWHHQQSRKQQNPVRVITSTSTALGQPTMLVRLAHLVDFRTLEELRFTSKRFRTAAMQAAHERLQAAIFSARVLICGRRDYSVDYPECMMIHEDDYDDSDGWGAVSHCSKGAFSVDFGKAQTLKLAFAEPGERGAAAFVPRDDADALVKWQTEFDWSGMEYGDNPDEDYEGHRIKLYWHPREGDCPQSVTDSCLATKGAIRLGHPVAIDEKKTGTRVDACFGASEAKSAPASVRYEVSEVNTYVDHGGDRAERKGQFRVRGAIVEFRALLVSLGQREQKLDEQRRTRAALYGTRVHYESYGTRVHYESDDEGVVSGYVHGESSHDSEPEANDFVDRGGYFDVDSYNEAVQEYNYREGYYPGGRNG